MKNFQFKIFNLKFSKGFTILEVIVALAILGIGLVVIMELFSGGLRSGKISKDYTEALIYARGKMDEILIDPKEGSDSGEFKEGYRWQGEVKEVDIKTEDKGMKNTEQNRKTYQVKVRVLFPGVGGEKAIELVTLKAEPIEK